MTNFEIVHLACGKRFEECMCGMTPNKPVSAYTPSTDAEIVPWVKSQLDMEIRQVAISLLQSENIRYLHITEVAEGDIHFEFRQSYNGNPGHVIMGVIRDYDNPTGTIEIEDITKHDCEDNDCDTKIGY